MDLLRKYLLSSAAVWQAPDTPAEPAAPDAAVAAAALAPEGGGDAPAAPETPAEPAPARQPPADTRPMVPVSTMMQRISSETRRVQEAQERATLAERRAADLEAMMERLRANPGAPAAPGAPAPAPAAPSARAPAGSDQDAHRAQVRAEAAAMRLYEDSLELRNRGMAAFGAGFTDTLRILEAVGATSNDEFVADVLAVDKANGHVILDRLAKDPERAVELAGMDSRRRVMELTRMAASIEQPAAAAAPKSDAKPAAPAAPAAPAVSKAPPPKPVHSPTAAAPAIDPTTAEGNDKMDDKAWQDWFNSEGHKQLFKQRA